MDNNIFRTLSIQELLNELEDCIFLIEVAESTIVIINESRLDERDKTELRRITMQSMTELNESRSIIEALLIERARAP